MTREEHLAWCKKRALAYCDINDPRQAFTSMASDLGKHEETKDHIGIQLGLSLMMIGSLSTVPEMRHFIEGFN
jgi:hypothetical protein